MNVDLICPDFRINVESDSESRNSSSIGSLSSSVVIPKASSTVQQASTESSHLGSTRSPPAPMSTTSTTTASTASTQSVSEIGEDFVVLSDDENDDDDLTESDYDGSL